MGRTPCCDKVGLKKGPWTPEEDQKLLAYIEEHGHGSWRALPAKAGLQRCGKSCRLRWTNYLRPDIKRGKFSLQEEQTIIQLHALLGNRWSAIATHLPKRTDNEIKNYWNTHLKKRLAKMGIDPVTHKPKNDALLSNDGQSKNAANLSHMAQWESARLEAEARLVRESKLRSRSFQHQLSSPDLIPPCTSSGPAAQPPPHRSVVDILKALKANELGCDLDSPTSTLTFSENAPPIMTTSSAAYGENSTAMFEFVGTSGSSEGALLKEEGEHDWKGMENSSNMQHYKDGIENSMSFTSRLQEMTLSMEGTNWTTSECLKTSNEVQVDDDNDVDEGFTNLLLNDSDDRSLSEGGGGDSDSGGSNGKGSHNEYEDSKNYWNSILDLVNSSPSDSQMF